MWGDSESASKIRRISSSEYENKDFYFSHWRLLSLHNPVARAARARGTLHTCASKQPRGAQRAILV